MSQQIDLGDGKFATVRDVDELRSGDTLAVNGSFVLKGDPEAGELIVPGDMDDKMWRALAARIITEWNLQWPIPRKNRNSLNELTLDQEDALSKGIQPHLDAIKRAKSGQPLDDEDPTVSAS